MTHRYPAGTCSLNMTGVLMPVPQAQHTSKDCRRACKACMAEEMRAEVRDIHTCLRGPKRAAPVVEQAWESPTWDEP